MASMNASVFCMEFYLCHLFFSMWKTASHKTPSQTWMLGQGGWAFPVQTRQTVTD